MNGIKTIKNVSAGIYKEKGSKFIANAYPVKSEEEINKILKKLSKEHYKARHICYAYSIGFNREKYKYSDSGEPQGTAGKPMYGQILSYNLTNILVVVIRYFGGILLGTGNLMRAYKTAANEALKNAEIINLNIEKIVHLEFEYDNFNDIMKVINRLSIKITNLNFDNNYSLTFIINENEIEEIKKCFSAFSNIKITVF